MIASSRRFAVEVALWYVCYIFNLFNLVLAISNLCREPVGDNMLFEVYKYSLRLEVLGSCCNCQLCMVDNLPLDTGMTIASNNSYKARIAGKHCIEIKTEKSEPILLALSQHHIWSHTCSKWNHPFKALTCGDVLNLYNKKLLIKQRHTVTNSQAAGTRDFALGLWEHNTDTAKTLPAYDWFWCFKTSRLSTQ